MPRYPRYTTTVIGAHKCDGYLIEHDMTPHYEGLLGDKQLGVGAVRSPAASIFLKSEEGHAGV